MTPFSTFVTQLKSTADTDTDGVAEPGEVARKLRSFIYDGAGGAVGGFNGLGPAGAGLLLDLNGDGTVTINDVVVTPQCNGDACADGTGLGELTDMRVTFKLGKTAFAGELPFDIGLEGFPLKLEGNVASAGKWSVLVDFGMSKEDGPYLVASGKPTKSNDSNMAVNRPPDQPANPDPDGDPDTEDGTPDKWFDQQYLQDDGANFPSFVDVGMTLRRLPQTGVTEARCTITKVGSNKLWCDDFSTAGVEGVTWHFHDANDPADTTPTDLYEVIALHPPNSNQTGGAAEVSFDASVGFGDKQDACVGDVDAGAAPRPYLQGFSTSRCLRGEVAFLAVTVRDRDGDRDAATYAEAGGASAETDEDPTKLGLQRRSTSATAATTGSRSPI